jgi:hypothetical protein
VRLSAPFEQSAKIICRVTNSYLGGIDGTGNIKNNIQEKKEDLLEIHIVMPDRKGQIANITRIALDADVDLADIKFSRIANSEHDEDGAKGMLNLRVLREESATLLAAFALKGFKATTWELGDTDVDNNSQAIQKVPEMKQKALSPPVVPPGSSTNAVKVVTTAAVQTDGVDTAKQLQEGTSVTSLEASAKQTKTEETQPRSANMVASDPPGTEQETVQQAQAQVQAHVLTSQVAAEAIEPAQLPVKIGAHEAQAQQELKLEKAGQDDAAEKPAAPPKVVSIDEFKELKLKEAGEKAAGEREQLTERW